MGHRECQGTRAQRPHLRLTVGAQDRYVRVPGRARAPTSEGVGAPLPAAVVHPSRDLLAQGTLRPSGEGDVRHWPTHTGPDAVLNLVLSPPHGAAHLTASLSVVTHWLERTYHLVPSGREGDGIDLNAELSRLLHGTA
ncbi:SsgA family sporulation/cell division regulator [Streptomyces mirabilis]|uniref:SsgA family sporulation/cell division regulator n=1 Tax=Streptomyces mirabilis TaxID=68239 RepID=UPI0033D10B42